MSAAAQELMESNGPIEISGAIPASVNGFAAELAEARVLALPLELPQITLAQPCCKAELEQAFKEFADFPGWGEWIDWIASWASRFGQLSGAEAVRLRMSHSSQPSCPRFHIDSVRLRLIATLLGPGTQWLPSADVTRTTDGKICQTPNPDRVEQIAPGSVGIFKGSTFDPELDGVVHRSPPDRIDRIVITVDMAA